MRQRHPKPNRPAEQERLGPDQLEQDLHLGVNRCPFCHDDVHLDQEEWVSCRNCLARHHAPCWGESQGCGSCGTTRFLAESEPGPGPGPSAPAQAPPSSGLRVLSRGLGRLAGRVQLVASAQSGTEASRWHTPLRCLLATVAVVATGFLIGDLDASDAALGAAVALPAWLALAGSFRDPRPSSMVGGFLGIWGVCMTLAASLSPHIARNHPETIWIGVGLAIGGALIYGLGQSLSEAPHPPGADETPLPLEPLEVQDGVLEALAPDTPEKADKAHGPDS